jgi:hypothetical protein
MISKFSNVSLKDTPLGFTVNLVKKFKISMYLFF